MYLGIAAGERPMESDGTGPRRKRLRWPTDPAENPWAAIPLCDSVPSVVKVLYSCGKLPAHPDPPNISPQPLPSRKVLTTQGRRAMPLQREYDVIVNRVNRATVAGLGLALVG